MKHDFAETDPPRRPPPADDDVPPPKPRGKKKAVAVAQPEPVAPPATPLVTVTSKPVEPRDPTPMELATLIGLIARGLTEFELVDAIEKAMPGVTPARAIDAAMVQIEKTVNVDPGSVFAWSMNAAQNLFKECMQAAAFADALRALKFINDTAVRLNTYNPNVPPKNSTGTGHPG